MNAEEGGSEDLNGAVLETVRESLRARRRQAAYMKKWSMCLMITPITLILTTHMPNKRKKLKIVAPKDFLNFVIPGHLTKTDFIFGKTIFPGKYFVTGWQAGTWVFIRESFGLKNVHFGAIWVPPILKMPLCHSGTKFHIFRLPNNI